mmetsp:Transcript_23474/g.54763  ORF Transcript_23474/g.54763 Transcript_23474/m.54763 type:complete len:291 (+) Transcript_23474:321-1193(+)
MAATSADNGVSRDSVLWSARDCSSLCCGPSLRIAATSCDRGVARDSSCHAGDAATPNCRGTLVEPSGGQLEAAACCMTWATSAENGVARAGSTMSSSSVGCCSGHAAGSRTSDRLERREQTSSSPASSTAASASGSSSSAASSWKVSPLSSLTPSAADTSVAGLSASASSCWPASNSSTPGATSMPWRCCPSPARHVATAMSASPRPSASRAWSTSCATTADALGVALTWLKNPTDSAEAGVPPPSVPRAEAIIMRTEGGLLPQLYASSFSSARLPVSWTVAGELSVGLA